MYTPKNEAKIYVAFLMLVGFLALTHSNEVYSGDANRSPGYGVAIKGYDSVAYFTEDRAIKGNEDFSYNWNESTWYFSKPENRDLFAANPERYAPQFGGHCASGLSMGKLVAADPEEWTIVDGKLYLNYNRSARDSWRQNKTTMIDKAEKNWTEIQKQD